MTTLAIAGSGGNPLIYDVTANFTAKNADRSWQQFFAWTLPTTGYWIIVLQFTYDNGASQSQFAWRWVGPDGAISPEAPLVGTSRSGTLKATYTLLWGAGGIVRGQGYSDNGGPHINPHTCLATFVPTPDYRI